MLENTLKKALSIFTTRLRRVSKAIFMTESLELLRDGYSVFVLYRVDVHQIAEHAVDTPAGAL